MQLPLLSFKWIPVFLVLLGYIAVVPDYAQGSTECSRQVFSPMDCPLSSSGEESNDNIGAQEGNIEEQIPYVIPFP